MKDYRDFDIKDYKRDNLNEKHPEFTKYPYREGKEIIAELIGTETFGPNMTGRFYSQNGYQCLKFIDISTKKKIVAFTHSIEIDMVERFLSKGQYFTIIMRVQRKEGCRRYTYYEIDSLIKKQ